MKNMETTMFLFACHFIVLVIVVCGSVSNIANIGFQSLACDHFERNRNFTNNIMLGLERLQTASGKSVLTCMRNLGLSPSVLASQSMTMVSRSPNVTSLQCHVLQFSSSDSDVNVKHEDEKPFCRLYTTKRESCKIPLVDGWTDASTIIWSNVLEMWLLCDNVKDGGGWTVIQRRQDGSVDFYRDWEDYKYGFGSIGGEFWLGLENIRQLLSSGRHEIRFDMTRSDGRQYYAVYDQFSIADESDWYRLTVGSYSGNAGNSFSQSHNGARFQTMDKNPNPSYLSCSEYYGGGFWYTSCHHTNPNGYYGDNTYGRGINWYHITGYDESLTHFEMKLRLSEAHT